MPSQGSTCNESIVL